jgi:two-component system, NtrC family, sensor histidine kinase HydH
VLSARADAAPVRLSSRGDVFVEGDLRLLEEALLNLVANGIEATPPGGEGS